LILPQQKRERERQSLIASVQKNDRVVTIGGIHGVVTAVHDNEVTLKVDEDNNVRLRFSRSAVARIVKPGEDDGESAVKVERVGMDRQRASIEFDAAAAQAGGKGGTVVFGFRQEDEAVKAVDSCPGNLRRTLAEKPHVQVYSDGTCNLFFVFEQMPDDKTLLALARKVKKAGAQEFMASAVAGDLRNQMTGIFGERAGFHMDPS